MFVFVFVCVCVCVVCLCVCVFGGRGEGGCHVANDRACVAVHSRGQHTLFTVHPIRTYVGGLPRDMRARTASRLRRQTEAVKDFIGCLNDVRYNGHSLHHKGSKEIGKAESTGEQSSYDGMLSSSSFCFA